MQLRSLVLASLACSFISLNVAQAAWHDPSSAPPYGTDNSYVPINTTGNSQIKNGLGGLGVDGQVQVIGANNTLIVNGKMGIGPYFGGNYNQPIDSTALLDIGDNVGNGQIRIRGPITGSYAPANAKVLSADNNGLTRWISDPFPIDQILPGFGISATSLVSGIVAIDTNVVQKTLPNTACNFKSAVYSINQNNLSINCRPFVTSISLPASSNGLSLIGPNGVKAVSVNLGGNLGLNGSNQITVTTPGSGTKFNGTELTFDNTNCGGIYGSYWVYNSGTGTWSCGTMYSSTPPGESVMEITSWTNPPVACPGAASTYGAWTDLGVVPQEYVTGDSTPGFHYVRRCVRNITNGNDRLCQVMYFRQRQVLPTPTYPPACPSGWSALTLSANYDTQEYGGSTSNFNNVRTCYRCL